MQVEDVKNIVIIGAGTMGHGIGLTFALGGYHVTLQDRDEDILGRAITRVRSDLKAFAEYGVIDRDAVPAALGRIATTTDLEQAAREADFVTEAVTENAAVKSSVFTDLDRYCPAHTILASNTSSLMLRDFTSGCTRRGKLLITHWINPPHIAPVVEVVRCQETSAETMEVVCSLLERAGKTPVKIMKEIPGLVHNRIQAGMIREVWALWEQGIASAQDIDLVVQGGFGLRLAVNGPLATCDLGGLDVWYATQMQLFKEISNNHQPSARLADMVQAGELGIKSGRGFFDYQDGASGQAIITQRDRLLIDILKARGEMGPSHGTEASHD